MSQFHRQPKYSSFGMTVFWCRTFGCANFGKLHVTQQKKKVKNVRLIFMLRPEVSLYLNSVLQLWSCLRSPHVTFYLVYGWQVGRKKKLMYMLNFDITRTTRISETATAIESLKVHENYNLLIHYHQIGYFYILCILWMIPARLDESRRSRVGAILGHDHPIH